MPRFVRPSIFRRRQRNALLSIPLIEALLRDDDDGMSEGDTINESEMQEDRMFNVVKIVKKPLRK